MKIKEKVQDFITASMENKNRELKFLKYLAIGVTRG